MIELIKRFRPLFDAILIDSPPVLSVPDARILARAADAVVLVVRAHQTQQEAAFAAVRCFGRGWPTDPRHRPQRLESQHVSIRTILVLRWV